MTISEEGWQEYVDKLSKINSKAGELMQAWIDKNGLDDIDAAIRYAYGLSTKYGEAAAALACEMYDAAAAASLAQFAPAMPAPTATFGEVSKAVEGTLKNLTNSVPATVSRLTKQAAADTTLQNAQRDGAQFAWIPHGDTCAFCIMLASNGWQRISKQALKNGHAKHIHANCNCEYAVRFNESTTVAGYDEDRYKAMFKDVPLDNWNTPDGLPPAGSNDAKLPLYERRVNALRREAYAENKDRINAQKRDAYEKRKELNSSAAEEIYVD